MAGKKLEVGSLAPDFSLKSQREEEIKLSNFRGQWVILYFYPKDNTPGCTIEANDFTKYAQDFQRMNAVILGVSPDSCASHSKFAKTQRLTITLLSDPEHTVLESYGVWQKKSFMGKTFWGVVRSTFLIDPEGKLAFIWRSVKAKGHAQSVKEKLRELEELLSSVRD